MANSTEARRRPRSPDDLLWRAATIFLYGFLIYVLLLLAAMTWATWGSRHAMAVVYKMAALQRASVSEISEVDRRHHLGEISDAERDSEHRRIAGRTSREVGFLHAEFADVSAPVWVHDFILLHQPILPRLLVACSIAVAIVIPVWRVQRRLHDRGYEWLSLGNCLWVIIALRETVRKIPPSSDLEVIPGYEDTTTSLIAIMRLRSAAPPEVG